jgi:hypothetical protein
MHDQSASSHPQPGPGGAHGARDADGKPDSVGKPDAVAKADAVTKAHAIYTPASLSFYDLAVHGLSNRFAWRCPTSNILGLYRRHLSVNHLEAAVGTGLFLDRVGTAFDRLVLLDINPHCLNVSGRRLRRFKPECRQADLLEPLTLDVEPFTSVGLTYVLHCLPGSMAEKLVVLDHLKPFIAQGAMLFGATILGDGIQPSGPARALLNVYNAKGVFNNTEDNLVALIDGLKQRFEHVNVAQHGLVALFSAC